MVVLITSSLPDEGKTLFTATLATMLAQSGRRVMVMDAVPPTGPGADEGEDAAADEWLDDAARRSGRPYRTMNLHDCGTIISSEEFENRLARARDAHDIVLIKAPPVLVLSDAAQLARLCDTVMILAHWRKTPYRTAEKAVRRLREAGIHVSGVVLTNVGIDEYPSEYVHETAYDPGRYRERFAAITSRRADDR